MDHARHTTAPAPRRAALLLVLLTLLAPPPLWQMSPPAPAAAQIRNGAGGNPAISSAVSCIRAGTDLGLAPGDSPPLAATCLASLLHYDAYGDSDGAGGDAPAGDAALLRFADTKPDGPEEPIPAARARVGEIGAVYGLAYASGRNPAAAGTPGASERTFVAAFTKRGTRFGSLGPGGIYTVADSYPDGDPRTARPFAAVPAVIQGPAGPAPHNPGDGTSPIFPDGSGESSYRPGRGGAHTPFDASSAWNETDPIAVGQVGRSSLGDLDLDPDERFLYVTNLRDKHVYRFDTWATDAQASMRRLPAFPNLLSGSACGASANAQPFALHVTRGWLYLGVTCTATTTQSAADLGFRVWRYDRSRDTAAALAGAWDTTPALMASLAPYAAQRSYGSARDMAWRPWTDAVPCGSLIGAHGLCPQPLLSDITIDEQGVMLLGFRDRFGDMTGMAPLPLSIPAGDLLRAPPDPAQPGRWLAPSATPSGEYYDDWHTVADSLEDKTEVTAGGLAYLPGARAGNHTGGEVVTTWLDPYSGSSFGAAWFDATAGGRPTAREQLYPSSTALRFFGKAQGLGDVELLCAWAAIGDRVWDDADADGVQDAGEPGISGVRVQLFDADDAAFARPLATVTTGDVDGDGVAGEFRLYVEPWKRYALRLDPAQFGAGGPLQGWSVTRQDRGGDDARDSDASAITRVVAALPALGNGEHDESIDIGLTRAPGTAELGDRIWADADADGLQDAGERGLPGGAISLLTCSDPWPLDCASWAPAGAAVSDAAGAYRFGALRPGAYRVQLASIPTGYTLAPADRGSDDTADSDILPAGLWSEPLLLGWDQRDTAQDAGLAPAVGDILVTLQAPAEALQGQPATYTVTAHPGAGVALDVTVRVLLPLGLTALSAPGASASGATISWSIPRLEPGAPQARTFTLTHSVLGPRPFSATIESRPPDSDLANNQAAASTIVTSPNLAIAFDPLPQADVAPGGQITYRLAVTNQADQRPRAGALDPTALAAATGVVVTQTLPPGLTFAGDSSSGQFPRSVAAGADGSTTLTWALGDMAAPGRQTIDVRAVVSARAPLPAALHSEARVSNTNRTDADLQVDNRAEWTTAVRYPDLAVDITVEGSDGPLTRGEGSRLTYRLAYRNLGLEQAEAVSLTLALPRGALLGSPSAAGFTAGDAADGRQTLTWNLGAIPAGAAASAIDVPVTVAAGAADAGDLTADATIGTATPELITANNRDSLVVRLVAPPPVPDVRGGDVRLAIHSALDPRARGGEAVYVSSGSSIAWPAGEVLDFTPLASIALPALTPEQRQFYQARATITGWRLVALGAPAGALEAGVSRDAFGRAGCRGGATPFGADGCGYRYLGPMSVTSDQPATLPAAPRQADMAGQAHAYWSADRPAAMRADVYTLAAPGLPAVSIVLEVWAEVGIVARETGEVVRQDAAPQRLARTFRVRLVAPRGMR